MLGDTPPPPQGYYQGVWVVGTLECDQGGRGRLGRDTNPPVGPQQFIFGFCRSLLRLGYSQATPHSPPRVSLPLGTGDN